MPIFDADQFQLGTALFRIRGAVRQRLINPFPPKVSTGAPDRDSEILLSSIGAETWRGGLLIERLLQNQPTDRLWESTLDSRWERELRLLPRATTVGPTQHTPGAGYTVFAAGQLPFNTADPDATPQNIAVHIWHDTVGGGPPVLTTWSDAGGAFTTIALSPAIERPPTIPQPSAANITDPAHTTWWLVFPVLSGMVWVSRSGTTLTAHYQVAGAGIPTSSHVVVWDARLWSYDYRTGLFYVCNDIADAASASPSLNAWTQKGSLVERPLEVKRLLVLYNSNGDPYIHAVTKGGLYGYDPVADKWSATMLTWPRKNSAGAATTWRGDGWIGVGQTLYDYDGRNARNLGIDRDFGLPGVVRGDIAQVADAFSWLAIGTTADDPTSPAHNATVLLWDGQGVHTLYRSVSPNIPFYWMQYLQADSPRLWWSDGAGTHYVDLPSQTYNPKMVTTVQYAPDGFARLPWWDAGWPEKTKTWAEVHIRTQGCTPRQVCTVTYSLDNDEAIPHEVLVAEMTDDGTGGAHKFLLGTLAADDGVVSHNIRFNVYMSTQDATLTPVIESIVVYYLLNSEKRYAYTFQVDATAGEGGRDEYELVAAGQAAVGQELFQQCSFRRTGREVGNLGTKRVTVTQFDNNIFHTGEDERAFFSVTVVEI